MYVCRRNQKTLENSQEAQEAKGRPCLLPNTHHRAQLDHRLDGRSSPTRFSFSSLSLADSQTHELPAGPHHVLVASAYWSCHVAWSPVSRSVRARMWIGKSSAPHRDPSVLKTENLASVVDIWAPPCRMLPVAPFFAKSRAPISVLPNAPTDWALSPLNPVRPLVVSWKPVAAPTAFQPTAFP